ncbi:porphobilinogen synthase [Garciella nitratireducens]|uniref:Delta-aminolevulinic acid dehydratase n=1 Tax=Garciella nitratireducens DSM 15102 TaxID=1121911 RepID=A0A1T4KJ58_9FIRM|nr:porphobilinogen synthase [Garciella nitratireducens]RBP41574.1 porphobilinogen synthase [Garciella nitratireducens]SJZ42444.1 porphobilinogen synthase [Garciella nitratireducens DSM 15102]
MIRRPRRLRTNEMIRSMVRETHLGIDSLVYPMFVIEGKKIKKEIPSMPGNYHFSVDTLVEEVKTLIDLGLKKILLFGIPKFKDEIASEAYNPNGIVQRAIRELKRNFGDSIYIITDVCLCEYTSTGHCGMIKDQRIDNDSTLPLLSKTALSHVEAGADMVAPSDMMDGRIAHMRRVLDENGFEFIPIMAYSAKYASAYYGPFREAADSAPHFGDRKSYQMDPANGKEALLEVKLDLEEGADIVMVKPALAYLDVIKKVKEISDVPVAAYNVSGEYSMLKMAINQGLIGKDVIQETLIAIKRAGADIIITYFAKEILEKGIL